MNLQPTGTKILIKITKKEESKIGNLYVASSKSLYQFMPHEIVSVGEDVTKVKSGQKVYISQHCGLDVAEGYKIVDEKEIIAVDKS